MSNVQFNLNVSASKDAFSQQFNASGVTAVMNSAGMLAVTLNLGTATSAISTASASALGYCFARNLSTSTVTTQTVSFGRSVGTTLHETVTLKPGEAAWLRLSAGNYAAKAGAANTPLLLQILED
jgi:cytoskeletal protein RodZ